MGIDPRHCQSVYLTLFYHFHDVAYCGGSLDYRDPSCKFGQVQDNEGYLILITILDSIYLNPYDDIANGSSESVSQAYTDNTSTYEVWERPNIHRVSLMNCGMMLLTCVPFSKRAIQLSPLTLAKFSIPYHWVKGLGFKKGVWVWHFMSEVSHPGTPSAWSPFLEGLGLPSLVPSPPSSLKVGLPKLLPAVGNHRWSDLGCQS